MDARWAEMPLHSGGFVGAGELEALEEVVLVRGDATGSCDGRALDLDAVTLDLAQQR